MQGYLGGISWAILSAKIIQMNCEREWKHDLTVAELLKKFFSIYSKWDWSRQVELCDSKVSDIVNKF